jgi:hypothetical protein
MPMSLVCEREHGEWKARQKKRSGYATLAAQEAAFASIRVSLHQSCILPGCSCRNHKKEKP